MKKVVNKMVLAKDNDMRDECDFTGGVSEPARLYRLL